MMVLLLVAYAFAHGGEDHGAPPAVTTTADATRISVAASSKEFEAVVRVQRGAAGEPVPVTLLIDDFTTSAPVADATPSITLSGPATVEVSFTSSTPGTYTGTATFPMDGEYAGAIAIGTPTRSDLLALTGLRLGPIDEGHGGATSAGTVARVVGLAVLAVALVGVGYALGRRRGAGVAVVLMAALAARGVGAHGGEDHGAAEAPSDSPTSGALRLPMESQFLVGLRTARLIHEPFQEQVPAVGRFVARPGGSATLRAPVAGELVEPPDGFPSPGSLVRAGQVLASVRGAVGTSDRTALAQARQEAANTLAEAKKALALAERDVEQAANLGDAISDRERLEREQSVAVARSAVEESTRAVQSIGDGAGAIIRAPVAGRLGPTLVRPGDQVAAGDAVFRIVDASGLWIEARIPERLAAGLISGAAATVIANADSRPLSAALLDAGQEADPATGTLTLTLAVDASSPDLRPGMSATVWLARGAPRDVLVVPDSAVVDSSGMSLAFVKVAPEQFELRELRLGARSGESWEVLSGLEVGERVVVGGTYPLRSLAGR